VTGCSKAKGDVQERGQASADDGDALALTFAQPVAPAEVEEEDRRKNSAGTVAAAARARCDDATRQRSPRLLGVFHAEQMVNGWPP
jgi:hypothetical protein